MKNLIFIILILIPKLILAQPAPPCNPGIGVWTVTETDATLWVCNSIGEAYVRSYAWSLGISRFDSGINASSSTFWRGDGTWSPASGSSGIPSGSIIFIDTGSCPTGYTEVAGLNGKMWRGTITANGDVGASFGSDSITPTINSLTAATQVFTGSSANTSAISAGTPTGTNATGTVTPLGTNGTVNITPLGAVSIGTFVNVATATTGNCAATNTNAGTGAATSCKATAPNLTVPAESHSGTLTFTGSSSITSAETFTGNSLGTHLHSSTATGTNGTSTVTGTLNSFDNRPAYINLIGCKKN